jgi:molecular chaperone IbpA
MKNTITWPQSSFIGFDRIWKELDQQITQGVSQSSAFPRHNIVKVDEEHSRIEIALAGYSLDDLSIEVSGETLTVSGSKDDSEVDYLHKGISYKSFTRKFRLSDSVVVKQADFVNGLLVVDLVSKVPEEKKTRSVNIGTGM